MAYQPNYGYFMPRGKGIVFIVYSYLHILYCYLSYFSYDPIKYE